MGENLAFNPLMGVVVGVEGGVGGVRRERVDMLSMRQGPSTMDACSYCLLVIILYE